MFERFFGEDSPNDRVERLEKRISQVKEMLEDEDSRLDLLKKEKELQQELASLEARLDKKRRGNSLIEAISTHPDSLEEAQSLINKTLKGK